MPSLDDVDEFQALIAALGRSAAETAAVLARLVPDVDELADAYPEEVDPYINASSLLTADWYDSLSDAVFAVEPAPPPARELLDYKARWAAAQPDPPAALSDCTERMVFEAHRDTVISNAEREGVRYARHASGNACPFCAMLAIRGATYRNEAGAKKSHDKCHCTVIPVREDDYYDEPPYVAQWRDEYDAARDEVEKAGDKANIDNISNAMRRSRHADNPEPERAYQRKYYDDHKEKITAQQRQRYAEQTYSDDQE